jgi:hypothetical protein
LLRSGAAVCMHLGHTWTLVTRLGETKARPDRDRFGGNMG